MVLRLRNACITWNNPPVEQLGPFGEDLPECITYLVWSLECGSSGNIHWQMYAEFNTTMTLSGIKKAFGNNTIHIEKRKGTAKQAADYCKKNDDTHLAGPWELGEISHQGVDMEARLEREDEISFITALRKGEAHLGDMPSDLIRSCPAGIKMALTLAPPVRRKQVDVYYIEGETGIGKTYGIFKMFPDAYRPVIAGEKLWFDGYAGEKTLLLDELRGNIKLSYLLQILDPYPLKVEIKGGTVNAEWERVFITTNTPPEKWYPRVSAEDPRTFEALLRRIGFRPLSPRYCVVKDRKALIDYWKLCFPLQWVDDEPTPLPSPIDSNGSPLVFDEEEHSDLA